MLATVSVNAVGGSGTATAIIVSSEENILGPAMFNAFTLNL